MTDQDETRDERPEAADDADSMERLREEIDKLPVSEHLLFMMQSLSSLAIGRLGLTQETAGRRDPEQARLAIDAFKALLDVLERGQPGPELLGHKGMLSQLQLAYAGAVGKGASDESAPEAAETAPAETPPAEEPPAKATTSGQDAEPEESAAPKKPAAAKKPAAKKSTAAPKKTAKKPTDSK